MKYNYHTHTYRCRHALGQDREYVEAAIAAGVEEMGFSDHAPLRFPDGFEAGYRMLTDSAEEYVRSINALKKEFAGKIRLHVGYEMEYYPAYFSEMLAFAKSLGVEYFILGQHFFIDERSSKPSGWENDSEADLKIYVDRVIEGMETGAYTYVAHPDLLHFTGAEEIYVREIRRLCAAAKRTNTPLEINFLGIRTNRFYPHDKFWELAGEAGAPVVVGYDAHEPKDAGDNESYVRANELIEKYRLNYLEKPELRFI
ncbi:MAG: histidinol-phosphatase [Clostridia bacterium]|nr:histidinol-phosphatase [Clostridia bacterium]